MNHAFFQFFTLETCHARLLTFPMLFFLNLTLLLFNGNIFFVYSMHERQVFAIYQN